MDRPQQIRGFYWLGRRVWWPLEPALAVSRQYKPCVWPPYPNGISCTGFERVHTAGNNDGWMPIPARITTPARLCHH
jgi:hypothetical protein